MKKTGRTIVTFDWAIKTILRDKANFDVLEGFLTALFKRPVIILDMLESESNQRDERDKYNRVDLLAKTEDGERIIVEVQYIPEKSYLRRLAYGTAKTIVETLKLARISHRGGWRRFSSHFNSIGYVPISQLPEQTVRNSRQPITALALELKRSLAPLACRSLNP